MFPVRWFLVSFIIWVPLLEVKGIVSGVGLAELIRVHNLAVGDEIAANDGAVLVGFPVAVEEIGLLRFGQHPRGSWWWHSEVSTPT